MGQLLMLLRRRIVIASLAKLEEAHQLAGETHSSGHVNDLVASKTSSGCIAF